MSSILELGPSVPKLTLTFEHLEANPDGGRHELFVQLARRWTNAKPCPIVSFREYDQYRLTRTRSLVERVAAYDVELDDYRQRVVTLQKQAEEIEDLARSEGIDDSMVLHLRDRAAALVAECRQRCDEWEGEKSRLLREPAETSLELSDVIAQARTLLLACA
jgi:hypothetical protein